MNSDDIARTGWQKLLASKEDGSPDLLDALCKASRLIRYQDGERVCEPSGEQRPMGLILSGHADVLRQTFGGREVWLTNLDPGDLVGVGPAMAAKPSAIWVIARGPVVMSTLPSATFFALAQRHGALSVAALSMFSRHFIGIAERLTLLLTASVSERLLACLATLGTVDEDRGERSILRDLPSVTRLAMLIHASREATSRALSELKRDGLVGTDGQAWWVVIPRDRPLDPWGQ